MEKIYLFDLESDKLTFFAVIPEMQVSTNTTYIYIFRLGGNQWKKKLFWNQGENATWIQPVPADMSNLRNFVFVR